MTGFGRGVVLGAAVIMAGVALIGLATDTQHLAAENRRLIEEIKGAPGMLPAWDQEKADAIAHRANPSMPLTAHVVRLGAPAEYISDPLRPWLKPLISSGGMPWITRDNRECADADLQCRWNDYRDTGPRDDR